MSEGLLKVASGQTSPAEMEAASICEGDMEDQKTTAGN